MTRQLATFVSIADPRIPQQARQLRAINQHHAGFRAVDWLIFRLYGAEVLLFGRASDDFYNVTMCLCRARRPFLRPSPLTPGGLDSAEHGVLKFMDAFYKVVKPRA